MKYRMAEVIEEAAFLVRNKWCIAFFWFLESSKILETLTMTSEMMNAPQNEVTMMIMRPMKQKGTRSPKPTVVIVITMTQTAWK
jgi:hypothetical protein